MTNKYHLSDDGKTAFIKLRSKTYGDHTCLIDAEDLPKVMEFPGTWRIHASKARKYDDDYYVYTQRKKNGSKAKSYYMHRVITSCPATLQVDHADFNGLNNQKGNLAVVTVMENALRKRGANSNSVTGVRGVSLSRENVKRPYRVSTKVMGVAKELGRYNTLAEAEAVVRKHWEKAGYADRMMAA